jgi:5-(carboxyamino)imidazole ribonucleotide synthase
VIGGLDSVDAAAQLTAASDVITFEIESIGPEVLSYLADNEKRGKVRVAPGVSVLQKLQNKALQKAWLVRNGLPTLPFRALPATYPRPERLTQKFGLPLVQKAQLGGYDGRGVQIIKSEEDMRNFWPVPSVVETFLPDAREIAVLVARSHDGSLMAYPAVSMTFDPVQNVLLEVTSPADVSTGIAKRAEAIATYAVERLGGVGLFAVELFLSAEQTLFINEISPRVHNAGHHTLESCPTSQFEQHLRAIAGLPLGQVTQARPAIMRNLLGATLPGATLPDATTASQAEPKLNADPGVTAENVFVHWYGKREPRPGRKMGHITCVQEEPAEARNLLNATIETLAPQLAIAS